MAEAVVDAGRVLDERDAARADAAQAEGGEGIAGERGRASFASGKKAAARGARAFVAVIVGLGAALALVIGAKAYQLRKREDAKAAAPVGRVEKKVHGLKLDPSGPGAPAVPGPDGARPRVVEAAIVGTGGFGQPPLTPAVDAGAGTPEPSSAPPAPPVGAAPAPAAEHPASIQDRRLARGFGGTANEEGGLAPVPPGEPEAGAAPASAPPRASGFEAKLEPTELRASAATLMKDRDYWITQGATLDCVLQTRIVSTVPGMVSCYLTRNVYSTSGRVVLLDRGSKLVGRYQSGVQQGEARIFVVWTRAETPNGVIVNLDSPGTGALGEAGVGGWTDTHFWDRFGAAIMVSLIQSGTTAVASRVAGASGATTINLQGPADASNQVVAKTYENTVNMPPTIYVNQGERVSIFVARDLNFQGVYGLERVRHDGE